MTQPSEAPRFGVAPGLDARSVRDGLLLMLLAGLCSSILHIAVRYLAPHLPAIQIVGLRSTFTMLVTLPVIWMMLGLDARTSRFDLHLMRGVVGVASMWSWYYALGQLPLADAGALSFTTGLFVTLGAAIVFREKVGWRRITALLVGFLGAVVILRPGQGVLTWPAIWAVLSSALWGVSLLFAKHLARYDKSITISFYQASLTAVMAMLLSLPGWTWPETWAWGLLMLMGVAAALGNFCYVQALRIAEASVIMPADYVRLIWMAGWGFLFLAEVPPITTWIGAAMIIGATAYIAVREARLAAERRREASAKPN